MTTQETYKSEAGFSLLETLIALAILSFASMALFQSTSMLLRLTNKSIEIGENVVDQAAARTQFDRIVQTVVPAWQENTEYVFRGDKTSFRGLSSAIPMQGPSQLRPFLMDLRTDAQGQTTLWVSSEGEELLLMKLGDQPATFSYLGADHQWYADWPLETPPSLGFFDDAAFMDIPQVPLAIRLYEPSNTTGSMTAYLAGRVDLPFRIDREIDDYSASE